MWVNIKNLRSGFETLLESIEQFEKGIDVPFADNDDPVWEEWGNTPGVSDFCCLIGKLKETEKIAREAIRTMKRERKTA